MADAVPTFFVYGEADRPLDIGFVHVETVMERRHLHQGVVAAHKHDRMTQLTFWLKGRGTYFVEDEQIEFEGPAVCLVPSGVVHGFAVEPDLTDAIVISVADSALPPIRALSVLDLQRPVFVRRTVDETGWSNLRHAMTRLLDDYLANDATSLFALIAVITNDIARLSKAAPERELSQYTDLALAFRGLVDLHFRQNWSIDCYIHKLGTSHHILSKACHQAFGAPPKGVIDARRLLEAKRLLMFTVRSVEDISYELGFHDPAYFSRFFRSRTGDPPGEWRAVQGAR